MLYQSVDDMGSFCQVNVLKLVQGLLHFVSDHSYGDIVVALVIFGADLAIERGGDFRIELDNLVSMLWTALRKFGFKSKRLIDVNELIIEDCS